MTAPDMTASIAPRSDQQNFDDYLTGPKTVCIEKVTRGTVEQPVEIHLVEFPGKPYKPSKSMRRVLVSAWGPDASTYAGRRLRLYGDPDVKFGGQTVGGIKISHLSHIDKKLTLSLTSTRGKRSPFVVEPLQDEPPVTEFERRIAEATTTLELDAIAKDLKARDLGTHRAQLLTTWSDRKTALENQEPDNA
jgi:hypothetical protein